MVAAREKVVAMMMIYLAIFLRKTNTKLCAVPPNYLAEVPWKVKVALM